MFTFTDRYQFDWPVKVVLPTAEGDVAQEFTGKFVLPPDELDIFQKADIETAAEMVEFVRARLSKWWVGWEGIKVEGGADLPFSAENRDALLRQRAVRLAVDKALSDAVLGIREKN